MGRVQINLMNLRDINSREDKEDKEKYSESYSKETIEK
jgi:hypothetical protein